MSGDFLLKLSENKLARDMVKRLGLPVPMPTPLRRGKGPWEREPVRDRLVVIGDAPGSSLAPHVASAVISAGARTAFVGDESHAPAYLQAGRTFDRPPLLGDGAVASDAPVDALVFDATGAAAVEDLQHLYRFFHAWLSRVARCGRIVVLGAAPGQGGAEAAAVRDSLKGFIRSLAKEVGRKGITATLIVVEPGAEARSIPVTRFFLSDRSAFVSGQVVLVDDSVKAGEEKPPYVRPLDGQIAVVTGAARGIGEAIATCLSREGARVICVDRPDPDSPLHTVAQRIGGVPLDLDITADDAASQIAAAVREHGESLSVLVHNAGVTRDKTLARMKPEQWDLAMAVNLAAITRQTPRLVEDVVGDGARIVCISSIAGIAGNYGQTNYAASKAGVIGYVKALAPVVARRGIAINAIAPGFIETQMTAAIPAATREVARRMNALSQGGRPIDVAELATFLASPGAGGVTGQVIRCCGMHMVGA